MEAIFLWCNAQGGKLKWLENDDLSLFHSFSIDQ